MKNQNEYDQTKPLDQKLSLKLNADEIQKCQRLSPKSVEASVAAPPATFGS